MKKQIIKIVLTSIVVLGFGLSIFAKNSGGSFLTDTGTGIPPITYPPPTDYTICTIEHVPVALSEVISTRLTPCYECLWDEGTQMGSGMYYAGTVAGNYIEETVCGKRSGVEYVEDCDQITVDPGNEAPCVMGMYIPFPAQ